METYVKFVQKISWPTITCFGYQSTLKKLITMANMSWTPFDIQRSKLVAKLNFAKTNKTYNCLIFSTNSRNIFCENYFLEGKTSLGHKYKHICFIHMLSTNCMGRWFLIVNKFISLRRNFWFLWKWFLVAKNLTIALPYGFEFFWQVVSISPFNGLFTSSSNFFVVKMT